MDPLAGHNYLNLATFRKTGVTVETPIWFAVVGDSYFAFSAGNAGKVKRLRNSSRARVAACDARGGLRGEWIDAEAFLVHDPETIETAHGALCRKYGLLMRVTDLLAGLTGHRKRRTFLEIRLVGATETP